MLILLVESKGRQAVTKQKKRYGRLSNYGIIQATEKQGVVNGLTRRALVDIIEFAQ